MLHEHAEIQNFSSSVENIAVEIGSGRLKIEIFTFDLVLSIVYFRFRIYLNNSRLFFKKTFLLCTLITGAVHWLSIIRLNS